MHLIMQFWVQLQSDTNFATLLILLVHNTGLMEKAWNGGQFLTNGSE